MPKLRISTLIIAIVLLFVISAKCDQPITYSEEEKYKRIDSDFKTVNKDLPSWDGGVWVWLSVKRIDNTIVYEFRALDSYKGGFDPDFYKNSLINTIRGDAELVSEQMNFKLIYIFPNNKEEIINIAPEDYLIKQ